MKDYHQENMRLVEDFYKAASRGDFGLVREALDPNVEWIEQNASGLWFGGTHRGAQAVWEKVISPAMEKFHSFRVKTRGFYTVGENIIVIGYFHGRAKTTGKELDAATAHIYTIHNGKIVRFEAFHDVDNWLDTLGLAKPELHRMAA